MGQGPLSILFCRYIKVDETIQSIFTNTLKSSQKLCEKVLAEMLRNRTAKVQDYMLTLRYLCRGA